MWWSLESRSRRSGHSSSLFSLASWRNRVFRHCLFLAKTKSLFFPQTPIDLVGEKGASPPPVFLPPFPSLLLVLVFVLWGVCGGIYMENRAPCSPDWLQTRYY